MSNIYGIRKSPEQRVRGNREMAMGAGSGAITGASKGMSMGGPLGAVAGAVIGGGAGYFTQKSAQAKEKNRAANIDAHNDTVEALEGRSTRIKSPYSNIARYGAKYENGGQIEMEGDGSGDPNGIGEVHTDKNYNIKSMANGKPTHEEGGVPISESNLEKGDLIFPWQKDDADYEKGMSMIRRYKTTGDQKAKKWLDDQVKTLPSDKDYGYDESDSKKYPDGVVVKSDGAWTYRRNNSTGEVDVKKKGSDKWVNLQEEVEKGNKDVDVDMVNAKIFDHYDKMEGKSISNVGDGIYGELGVESNLPKGSNLNDKNSNIPKFQTNAGVDNFSGMLSPEQGMRENKMTPKQFKGFDSRYPGVNDISDKAKSMSSEPAYGDNFLDEEGDIPTSDAETDGFQTTPIKDRTDYTKYANVARNLYKGMDEPELTTRRYFTPEELDYSDRSYSQRSAIAEQRNAGQQSLRGKGLSAGQMQGYNRQLGANALRANQQVNEREAQRADSIAQFNLGNRNAANNQNLQLANQYDVQDLQNAAAQQRYMNTAFSEIAQLGQINERQRYAVDRDNALMKNDMNTAKLMGTKHYNYSKSPYEVSFDPQFVPDYNKVESKTRTVKPNKRYGN